MVVMILERVSSALRGELSRWLIEPRTGVFVGNVSGLVRDRLWQKVEEETVRKRAGAGILIQTARCEQGFRIRTIGDPTRTPVDWEGLTLIRIREPGKKAVPPREAGALAKGKAAVVETAETPPIQHPVGVEPSEGSEAPLCDGIRPAPSPAVEESSEPTA